MNLKDNARKQLLPARRNLDCLTGSGSLKERRTKYLANSFLNTFDARPIKSVRRAITKLGEKKLDQAPEDTFASYRCFPSG